MTTRTHAELFDEVDLALAKERKLAREQADALTALMNSQGWDILMEVVASQYDARVSQILGAPATPETTLAQEYLKGEAAALLLLKTLPKHMIESAQVTLRNIGEDEIDETDN